MSVIINNMAMPKNCNECRMMEIIDREDGTFRYICIAHLNEIVNLKERLDTCPLVELHDNGDLRQALKTALTNWQMEYAENGKDVERFETLGAVIELVEQIWKGAKNEHTEDA